VAALTLGSALAASACASRAPTGFDTDEGPFATEPDAAEAPLRCPTFAPLAVTGEIATDEAVELSGLVASVDHPGVLWTHNDDDGPARILGVTAAGALVATIALDAAVVDFEDIGLVPGPTGGPDQLYLADTGDNDLDRASVRLLRIDEPTVDPAATGQRRAVADVDVFELRYGDGLAHDAEAFIVEPDSGDLTLFTKRGDGDPRSLVFHLAGLAALGAGVHTLEPLLDERDAPGLDAAVVTASLSPDGSMVLVGFKDEDFHLWPRAGSIADTLRRSSCSAPRAPGQVEGASFQPDSAGYYMVAEGDSPAIVQVSFER
jgi:hypothetical protein